MENSPQNGKQSEPTTATDQIPTKDTQEQTPIPGTYKRGVFLARKPGQSFEEFENGCVEAFRKAGLLKG